MCGEIVEIFLKIVDCWVREQRMCGVRGLVVSWICGWRGEGSRHTMRGESVVGGCVEQLLRFLSLEIRGFVD